MRLRWHRRDAPVKRRVGDPPLRAGRRRPISGYAVTGRATLGARFALVHYVAIGVEMSFTAGEVTTRFSPCSIPPYCYADPHSSVYLALDAALVGYFPLP